MPAVLAWCLKNWRLVAYAAAAVAAVWVLLLVRHWHHESTVALPEALQALKNEQSCGTGSECQKRTAALVARQAAIQKETVTEYETRLAEIAARPAPVIPVRLCRPADRGVRVAGPAPATGAGGGADVPLEAGRDIALELYRLADDADTEALKLRLLWDRDRALAQPPK